MKKARTYVIPPMARAIPKFPLLPVQCASCPFRSGNDEELGEVVRRLRKKWDMSQKVGPADIAHTRKMLRIDAYRAAEFLFHGSVYDAEMNERPRHEHRGCPGAVEWKNANGPKSQRPNPIEGCLS